MKTAREILRSIAGDTNPSIKDAIEAMEAYASQQPVSVSRETVEKMLEALKVCHAALSSYNKHPIIDRSVELAIQQAEKELNEK